MKTVINTSLGMCEGVCEKGYVRWFGIPYAKPPVGDLRFKRAIENEGWDGIKFFDRMGPKPVQMAGGKFADMTHTDNRESENCLSLNVWAPDREEEDSLKPVFVWIYGGGHHAGEASAPEYYLDSFAKNDVVAVSFNYRLGVLGFYDFSDIDSEFESNCGISDMILALKWINDNISNFGGDPKRVTICGESAGASAILALIACPAVKDYFSQAIVMSGVLSNTSGSRMQRINNEKYLKWIGVDASEIKKLKTMSVDELKKGCEPFFAQKEMTDPGIMANGPVIDDLVTKKPLDAIKAGAAAGKNIIFGTCRDEGNLFYYMKICPEKWDDVEKMLKINGYGNRISEFHEIYDNPNQVKSIVSINRDRMFWADTMKCALAQSEFADTYMYRFDYVTPLSRLLKLNATHSTDVCPVLNTREGRMSLFYKGMLKSSLKPLFSQMHGAVLNFIKTGNPSSDLVGEWPVFDKATKMAMIFSSDTAVSNEVFDEKKYRLWEDIELYAGD